MIKRIVFSALLFDLFIALGISLVWFSNGIEPHHVKLGNAFLSFINNTNRDLNNFKIEIPNIPLIEPLSSVSFGGQWYEIIVNVFINFVNIFFTFINGLVRVINFLITLINYIIQLIEFIVLIIRNAIIFKDSVSAT